jgi:putative endonuclease
MPPPPRPRHWAEERVERWLERRGWRALGRNVGSRHGEVDLVMREGDTIVFVEVRQRSGEAFGGAAESLTGPKRARVRRVAAAWLAAHGLSDASVRFDAVLVRGARQRARVTLVRDAF